MNAIIVDDEKNGIDALKWELNRFSPEVVVVQSFTSPSLAIDYLNQEHSVDVLFLDIQMPEMNGFEMIEKIEAIDFSIVFVTSFDKYALKAFEYSALDYVLKPADKESLQRAISKLDQKRNPTTQEYQQKLEIHKSAVSGNLPEKVVFSTKEALEFIDPSEILYCESYSNYTTLYFRNLEKLVVSKTLKEIDVLLHAYNFQRIHQRFVVNMSAIKRFVKKGGGSVELENGQELSVSRAKKDELLQRLRSYMKG